MKSKGRLSFGAVCALACLLAFAPAWPPAAHAAGHAREARAAGRPLTTEEIARLALPSVVSITILDKTGAPAALGSGFVIAPNLIATNLHVVIGAHAATANFQSGRSETIYGIVSLDFSRDLALLYADTTGIRPLPLSTGSPAIGEPVVAVGSPEGLNGSISTGIISAIRTVGGIKIIQTTAAISHGSSGGALIDSHGRVIGVTSLILPDGENLNFAYPAYYLRQLMPRGAPVYTSWELIESKLKDKWTIPEEDAGDSNTDSDTDSGAASSQQGVNSGWQTALASAHSATVSGIGITAKPLAGLKAVYVVVEKLQQNALSAGLDTQAIQADVESQLRQAGIPVVKQDDADLDRKDPSFAYLYVNVNSVESGTNAVYAYNVDLNLEEDACLLRPTPALRGGAATWTDGETGISDQGDFVTDVRRSVQGLVSDFVNDWQAQTSQN